MRTPAVALALASAAAAAVASCGSPARRPVENTPAPTVDPRDYELGLGVPRDYRRAVAIYDERCAAGCGDLAACRRAFDLVHVGRGRMPTTDDVGTLMRMCDRGDAIGCGAMAVIGLATGHSDIVAAPAPVPDCDAGDQSACEAELWSFDATFGPYDEPGATAERDERDRTRAEQRLTGTLSRLCRHDMLAACLKIVDDELGYCTEPTCVADRSAQLVKWGLDPAPLHTAWFATTSACGRGDADACARVPDHAIDPHVLCAAGDYDACAGLGRGRRGATDAVIDELRRLPVERWRGAITCPAEATATAARR